MLRKIKLSFFYGLFSAVLFLAISGCAGSKPDSNGDEIKGAEDVKDVEMGSGDKVEESKQAAEAAEWEAHRLREELHRKKKTGN